MRPERLGDWSVATWQRQSRVCLPHKLFPSWICYWHLGHSSFKVQDWDGTWEGQQGVLMVKTRNNTPQRPTQVNSCEVDSRVLPPWCQGHLTRCSMGVAAGD